jgi:hypothetical protein
MWNDFFVNFSKIPIRSQSSVHRVTLLWLLNFGVKWTVEVYEEGKCCFIILCLSFSLPQSKTSQLTLSFDVISRYFNNPYSFSSATAGMFMCLVITAVGMARIIDSRPHHLLCFSIGKL